MICPALHQAEQYSVDFGCRVLLLLPIHSYAIETFCMSACSVKRPIKRYGCIKFSSLYLLNLPNVRPLLCCRFIFQNDLAYMSSFVSLLQKSTAPGVWMHLYGWHQLLFSLTVGDVKFQEVKSPYLIWSSVYQKQPSQLLSILVVFPFGSLISNCLQIQSIFFNYPNTIPTLRQFMPVVNMLFSSSNIYSLRPKKHVTLGFKICPQNKSSYPIQKVHVHVRINQCQIWIINRGKHGYFTFLLICPRIPTMTCFWDGGSTQNRKGNV